MYLTKQLTLFKTPLSPTYENVYDDYSTYTDYENFLLNNFSHIEIDIVDDMEVGRDKSVIDKNGIFSLVVKNHSSMDIHDYNYCCFETDKNTSRPLFAFILSVDSLNDSRTSPSCRINCQLDAWTHNIFDMQSGYDVNHIECRHMIESELDGGDLKSIQYITDEGETITECIRNLSIPKLLWARVTTGNEVKCIASTSPPSYEDASSYGTYPLNSTTPTFFIPMFVCVPLTGEIKFEYHDAYSADNMRIRVMTDGSAINGLFTSGTEIISIELTYYAPYTYTLDEENNRVIISANYAIPEKNGNIYTLYDKSNSLMFFKGGFMSPDSDVHVLGKLTNYNIKHYENLSCFYAKYFPHELSELQLNNEGYYEGLIGRLLHYPFNYSSVIANNREIDAIPEIGRKELRVYIDFQDTTKPLIKIYQVHNDNTIELVQFETLESNGEVTTTVDSYESFKRNNGNKMIVGALTGLNMGAKFTKTSNPIETNAIVPYGMTAGNMPMQHGIAGKLDFGMIASTLAMTGATIADAKNKMDDYKRAQINALDNPLLQDYIGRKDYKYIDCMTSRQIIRKLHDFGININQRLSVREKTHFTFDYVRTNNCRLPMIGNIDDRREIETAYDRGITKWHIHDNSTGAYMRTFSKNIPNMDLVQQAYYSVG